MLDDQEKNHNGGQFKREFLINRNQEREVQRKKDQEIEDNRYWASHPDEYKQVEENKKKIAEIMSGVEAIDKEIRLLENDKRPIDTKKVNVEISISDKKQMIEKLGKKVFGKKKAEEEIKVLNEEIEGLLQELQILYNEIKTAEKPISNKKLEKSNLEEEIKRLEQANTKLRNK